MREKTWDGLGQKTKKRKKKHNLLQPISKIYQENNLIIKIKNKSENNLIFLCNNVIFVEIALEITNVIFVKKIAAHHV